MSFRQLLLRTTAGLVLLALAGATYQGVTTAVERHTFVRPGGMVDAGGHQLHIYCTGTGAPTVVLEAPAAGNAAAWSWVQPRVAQATRTCSYDRAGLGWSERGDGAYDPAATAEDLHTLLRRANERGPFILAGEGFGASLAVLFASRFGDDVTGLVLVDPPSAQTASSAGNALGNITALTPWLARVGLLRAAGTLADRAAGLPPPFGGAMRAFLNRPDHLARAADELSRWTDVVDRAGAATVSAHVSTARVDAAGRDRLAFLTTESAAAPVVDAILSAVTKARAQGRIASAPPDQ